MIRRRRLAEIQRRLAERAVLVGRPEAELVAGVDAAYTGTHAFAAAVVVDVRSMQVVERVAACQRVHLPYIPGYFAFREMGAAIKALRRLKSRADVLLVNGHGAAHPRRCGIATHLGVLLRMPAIGVASRLLCGRVEQGKEPAPVVHSGEVVGYALHCGRAVYVSPGHGISAENAAALVAGLPFRKHLPLPLHEAHATAEAVKKRIINGDAEIIFEGEGYGKGERIHR